MSNFFGCWGVLGQSGKKQLQKGAIGNPIPFRFVCSCFAYKTITESDTVKEDTKTCRYISPRPPQASEPYFGNPRLSSSLSLGILRQARNAASSTWDRKGGGRARARAMLARKEKIP